MSKDQGKQKTKHEQKQNPPAKEKQKIDPTELTEEDLDKVSGGTGSPTGTDYLKYQIKW